MLLMSGVSKTYRNGSVALKNIDLHIKPGEFVFIVGPSGAGKSTFIKMLFKEVLPTLSDADKSYLLGLGEGMAIHAGIDPTKKEKENQDGQED